MLKGFGIHIMSVSCMGKLGWVGARWIGCSVVWVDCRSIIFDVCCCIMILLFYYSTIVIISTNVSGGSHSTWNKVFGGEDIWDLLPWLKSILMTKVQPGKISEL